MPLDVQQLLTPISADAPCGTDLRYDRRALEVLRQAEGKPEQVMGDQTIPAEEPDWREIRDGCLEVFAVGKDLRVAAWLTLASVKLDGFPGLRDGLALVRGLLDQYWALFFPQLDPDDNNDPTERANILSSFNTPYKTFGDVMRIHERIMEAPLCESRQLGRFGLKDIMIASGELAQEPGVSATAPDLKIIDGAFDETDLDKLQALESATREAWEHAQVVDKSFTASAGANRAPEMTKFITLLKDAHTQVRRRLDRRMGVVSDVDSAPGTDGNTGDASRPNSLRLDGELTNRDQVGVLFDKIYRYYERSEPSSPVPLLMKCCGRMVGRRFTDIVKVLTPDAVALLERLATPDETDASPPPSG